MHAYSGRTGLSLLSLLSFSAACSPVADQPGSPRQTHSFRRKAHSHDGERHLRQACHLGGIIGAFNHLMSSNPASRSGDTPCTCDSVSVRVHRRLSKIMMISCPVAGFREADDLTMTILRTISQYAIAMDTRYGSEKETHKKDYIHSTSTTSSTSTFLKQQLSTHNPTPPTTHTYNHVQHRREALQHCQLLHWRCQANHWREDR